MEDEPLFFDQERLEYMIKDLLCTPHIWRYATKHAGVREFRIKADAYKLQKKIYEWLSVPERKENFELMGGGDA